jgi:hypothetical protein
MSDREPVQRVTPTKPARETRIVDPGTPLVSIGGDLMICPL